MSGRPPLFAARTMAWIVGLSVASFLLAFVMAAYGDALRSDVSPWADSYSRSAIGHRALAETLARSGVDARRRTGRLGDQPGPDAPLLLLEPGGGRLTGSWDGVADLLDDAYARDAAAVLALPKWTGVPDENRLRLAGALPLPLATTVRRMNAELEDILYEPLEVGRDEGVGTTTCRAAVGDDGPRPLVEYEVDVRDLQLLAPSRDLVPVVECDDGLLVADVSDLEDRRVRLIADPDVLNNHGLGRGDHAALVRDVVVSGLGASAVVLDETIHGHGVSESLVREALSFPLVLVVAHGLLAVGAVVWAGARRFGAPRPPAPPYTDGKRVLIDNAAQLLALGRHSAESLERYFSRTLRAVAARFGMQVDRSPDVLVPELQRLSDARGVDISLDAIRRRIREGLPSDDHAVRLARHLHRWRKEMTDGPGHDS